MSRPVRLQPPRCRRCRVKHSNAPVLRIERPIRPAPKPEPRPVPAKRFSNSSIKPELHSAKLLRARKMDAKRKPIRKRNPKRKVSEFARTYHSKERVQFVKSLPCYVMGSLGSTENAHVCDDGSKGMGRKSGYRCIAPLGQIPHRLLHSDPVEFYRRYRVTPGEMELAAAATESLWQAHRG